jgi:hypothetical protein
MVQNCKCKTSDKKIGSGWDNGELSQAKGSWRLQKTQNGVSKSSFASIIRQSTWSYIVNKQSICQRHNRDFILSGRKILYSVVLAVVGWR